MSAWLVIGANAHLHQPAGVVRDAGGTRVADPFAHLLTGAAFTHFCMP